MRDHSLISNPITFPSDLEITGQTLDCIQSYQYNYKKHYGIQYHPESFATEHGEQIINNFVRLAMKGS